MTRRVPAGAASAQPAAPQDRPPEQAQLPVRRGGGCRRAALFVVVCGLVVIAGAAIGSWVVYRQLFGPGPGAAAAGTTPATTAPAADDPTAAEQLTAAEQPVVEFRVNRGDTLRTVTRKLAAAGLVRSAVLLEWYATLTGNAGRLQAGDFRVPVGTPVATILRLLVTGEAIDRSVLVTIPEGFRVDQIADRLAARGIVVHADAFPAAAVMGPQYRDFAVLNHLADGVSLEGYLFPDSYRLVPGWSAERIVQMMVANFERRVGADFLLRVAESQRSLHDIVTLASIVQGESPPDDMPLIAGVFWNRLQIGQRLESDATVNYVLGTANRQPTFADTRVQHPYNTYRNAGLPPGPIGSPGLAAIRAAFQPADHQFFFFLHPLDGTTIASRTYEEHLLNKARYLD